MDRKIRSKPNSKGKYKKENVSPSDSGSESDAFQKGDDESIDDSASEIGWNSDDEIAFGRYLGKNTLQGDTGDDDSCSESDQEEPKDGEILLSDMLDSRMLASSSSSHKPKTTVINISSSDDEDEDEDEDDDDLEEVHNRLLSSIDKFAKTVEISHTKSSAQQHPNQSAQESSYSSVLDGAHVSMNALLGALDDSKDIGTIKKRLADLERGLAAPAYVEKVTSDRLERHVVYDSARADMGKWQDTVVSNRHVHVLDLAQDKRRLASCKLLVTKHVPSTALERDIQMVLVKHGTSDQAADQIESDELAARNVSPEEVRERQAELAKVKALMFYEQMKRHRLNKIKSKAYRSIHKRQRTRLSKKGAVQGGEGAAEGEDSEDGEADPEVAAEQREKNALARVKERMDMRHKNTSKWARMALLHGHADKNLRLAYHESVQLGHELTQRMHEDVGASSSQQQNSDGETEGDVYALPRGVAGVKRGRSVVEDAAGEMRDILSGGGDKAGQEVEGRFKKLFDMDFMRKAVDQQRERAREDAENVLREIADMEEEGEDQQRGEPAEATGKRKRSDEAVTAARKEVSGLIGGHGQGSLMSLGGKRHGGKVSTASSLVIGDQQSVANQKQPSVHSTVAVVGSAEENDVQDNPWLGAATTAEFSGNSVTKVKVVPAAPVSINSSSQNGKNKQKQTTKSAPATTSNSKLPNNAKKQKLNESSGLQVAGNVTATLSTSNGNDLPPALSVKQNKLPARAPLLMQKSQEDLVRLAFAGPDLEAEFDAFKRGEVDGELGLDDRRAAVLSTVKAGWGDWAGPGASAVSQKILDKRTKMLTQIHTESETKRLVRKDNKVLNVHINERRVKAASKYKIADIPHPFTSWEQYERSLQMPLGEDWNASNVVKSNTQPDIKLRAGRIIEPIKLAKNRQSPQIKK